MQSSPIILTSQQKRVPPRFWTVQSRVVLLESVLVGAGSAALVVVGAVHPLLLAHPAQVPLAAVGRVVAGFTENFDASGHLGCEG